jgi:hypothetical protein
VNVGGSELNDDARHWRSSAWLRLVLLEGNVADLRAAVDRSCADGILAATNQLSSETSGLVAWLHQTKSPPGVAAIEAALGALAGVLRNAVVAARALTEATPERKVAVEAACRSMLGLSAHHFSEINVMCIELLDGP